MVGSEPNGSNQIGVAPGAKYIAVKAFTAAGGSDADLLEAAQWILAPTDASGNARVDMAPDVVNNSWGGGPGLDEWYRDVVINWRAAEIFPEFSAGNTTFQTQVVQDQSQHLQTILNLLQQVQLILITKLEVSLYADLHHTVKLNQIFQHQV